MSSKSKRTETKDLKGVIKLSMFLTWGFSFMTYSGSFKAHDTSNLALFVAGIALFGLTCWGLILMYKKTNNLEEKVVLYFGVATIMCSWECLWMYYEILYKIAFVDSPIYLVLGIAGYIILDGAILFYRYKVDKGDFKNRSGAPKYSIIISGTLICSILFKGYLEKLPSGMGPFIMAATALFISYAFSFGVTQLYEYWKILSSRKKLCK